MLTFMAGILTGIAAAGVWFWVFVIFGLIGCSIVTYCDRYGIGIIMLIAIITLIEALSKVSIVGYIKSMDGVLLAKWILAGITFHISWGFIRFKLYAIDKRKELSKNLGRYNIEETKRDMRFDKYNMRDKFITWVIFAPFSFVGVLIGDWITKLIEIMYDMFESFFRRVWDNSFKPLKIKIESTENQNRTGLSA